MKQVERLRKLINENLYESKSDIQKRFGNPTKKSDHCIWFYRNFKFSPINYETIFIFDEDIVVDICIYEYFLGIEMKNIFIMKVKTQSIKKSPLCNKSLL